MKNPFTIRHLQADDAQEVQQVALQSWQYTYGDIFSEEKIIEFNSNAYNPKKLQWLADTKASSDPLADFYTFLIMEDTRAEVLIGFVQINYQNFWEIQNSEDSENSIEAIPVVLSRIYLKPEYIGKGLGKNLLRQAEDWVRLQKRSKYGLWVHQDNEIGKSFYFKMGFVRKTDLDKDDEWFLEKTIDI